MTTVIVVWIVLPIALAWGGLQYVSQLLGFAEDAERGKLR